MNVRRRPLVLSFVISLVLGIGALREFAAGAPPASSAETVKRTSSDRAGASRWRATRKRRAASAVTFNQEDCFARISALCARFFAW